MNSTPDKTDVVPCVDAILHRLRQDSLSIIITSQEKYGDFSVVIVTTDSLAGIETADSLDESLTTSIKALAGMYQKESIRGSDISRK